MTLQLEIHPQNPQERLIRQAVDIVHDGGIVAYPTDSGYALGCSIGNKDGLERIRRIRALGPDHNFTLICRDLSESATYANFDDRIYRILRSNTPGSYTFILRATKEVPRRLLHPKRKTIGLRVPDHRITLALLAELDEPMMSTTLILPGGEQPLSEAIEIRAHLENQVDLVIDGGFCPADPTTVVDLTEETPRVLRRGKGDPEPFL
jgi:tRNA threonylcarbamoyl adenosine modification protein (Sua5/YciO/YrdC/YwlC family)